MSNYIDLSLRIKTNSKEQREQIFEEVKNMPIGDKHCCRYYSCERSGDDEISYCVNMRGGLNIEVWQIAELPLRYPDIIVEAITTDTLCGVLGHYVFRKDGWEEFMTIQDRACDCDRYSEFSLDMLKLDTYRKVYDWDNNLITEEHEIVPLPEDLMPEDVCEDYQRWKEDPIKWEEEKEKEREDKRQRIVAPMNCEDNERIIDDLPF